jgi:hypothetical protein
MKMFWKLYKNTPKKLRKAFLRMHFWAWMFEKHPKIFKFCETHLKCDTLPF